MRISNIHRIKNNNSVRRVAWHTKCDHEVSFHFSAFIFSQLNPLDAAHSKYCGKTEHQCGEDVVYLKTVGNEIGAK